MENIEKLEYELLEAVNSNDILKVRKLSQNYQFADFAEILEMLDKTIVLKIFRMLEVEEAGEIFTYLDAENQEYIINSYSSKEIKEIVEELYADDLIDLIDELPSELVKKILKSTNKEQRTDINNILKYKDETAGGIMSVDFVEVKDHHSVEDVKKIIKNRHHDFDELEQIFVTNSKGALIGVLEMKQLILNDNATKVAKLINKRFITIQPEVDQEVVGDMFKKYDIKTIPVINKQNKIIGIVTVDDVIDVLVEESTEDLQKYVGIHIAEPDYFKTSKWKMFKSRSKWLSLSLILGTILQAIIIALINSYASNNNELLNSLLSMVLIISSVVIISGTQSSLMMIRSLNLKQIHKKEVKEIFIKEALVSLILAITIIVINILRMLLVYLVQFNLDLTNALVWKSLLISSLTILISIIAINLIGIFLPLILNKIKYDPSKFSMPIIILLSLFLTSICMLAVGLIFV